MHPLRRRISIWMTFREVYSRFEGLIPTFLEVYCHFEGLLKDETPSIGVEISTHVLWVFAYISPSKWQ